MKRFLSILFSSISIFLDAQFASLDILPTQGRWAMYKGYIDNLEIEVTPEGHTARVELTFVVYVDSVNYHTNNYTRRLPTYRDNLLEAQMKFKMPEEAYFYDSYLWLNPTTIIRAKLLPRGEANWVYDSIVNRKIDPSILQHDQNGNYSLKIFPISTVFARKVKIAYSIPYKIEENGREFVELPGDILKQVKPSSQTTVVLNNKPQFKFKHLVFPLTGKIINETSSSVTLNVNNTNLLSNPKCYIEYQNDRPKRILSMFHQKLNAEENFYGLRIFTKGISNLTKSISSFGIKIPMKNNGFVYQSYNNGKGQLSSNNSYIECGRFFGDIDFDKEIELNYKVGSNLYTVSDTLEIQNQGEYIHQNWVHLFSQNVSNEETQELSLKYRVLNRQTAFLALENGDTVGSTKGYSTVDIDGDGSSIQRAETKSIAIYPNPIVKEFVIESSANMISIRILDISGRLIYSNELPKGLKQIELNSEELNMKRGVYWIIIEDKFQIHTLKVLKE
ncbi:MAG: T9SS type A sorting domain-containing protein [Chitinophagales bacterium]|jgi:hypothetical protein